RMKQADISTSVDLRLHPARVPPCLFRTWIGCTSLYERLPRHRRPFGLSVRSHESSGSSLLGDQHELKTYRTGYGSVAMVGACADHRRGYAVYRSLAIQL